MDTLCIHHRVVARYLEAKPTGRAKGWETRKENDEFAKQNIPEEYHALWEKVKGQFKGDPHTRYEKFMEYIEVGGGAEDNIHVVMENAEKMLKEQQKKEKKETLCRKRCPSCYSGDDDGDTPF